MRHSRRLARVGGFPARSLNLIVDDVDSVPGLRLGAPDRHPLRVFDIKVPLPQRNTLRGGPETMMRIAGNKL
jgi:hypothetical protein